MRISFLTASAIGLVMAAGASVGAKADPINILIGVPGSNVLLSASSLSGGASIPQTTISTLTIQASATGTPLVPQP